MERYGADAIHYNYDGDKNLFYLGEAKTYSSKYKFNTAIKDAIESILNTYNNHRKEIKTYVYDSFIDDKLISIASRYINGTLTNAEIHLVSIITYCETDKIEKHNEAQIKSDIIKAIESKGSSVDKKIYDIIDAGLHPRFNYIVFPVWELDELLKEFQKLIGK
jgi:hypothetical protein